MEKKRQVKKKANAEEVAYVKRIAVIGGGITGLTALYELQKAKRRQNLDIELILIEKNSRLGGKIASYHKDGFIMETGADSIVARKDNVMYLVDELGLQDDLVYNATGLSYICTDGELHAIPEDSVFGIPLNEEALHASTLLSENAKREVLKEASLPNRSFTKEDSIGDFLEYFLGKEMVDRQIAPVLSGVYSGDLHQLSIESTLPFLLDYKNEYGSILKGLEANQAQFKRAGNKKFISFRNGLSTVVDAFEEVLSDVSFHKGQGSTSIVPASEGYRIKLEDGASIEADYVVVATEHQAAQQMLASKELDQVFNSFHDKSLISIYMAFDVAGNVLPANGTGFIAAEDSGLLCNACTWTSAKWPNTSRDGRLLVRLFYKNTLSNFDELLKMDEETLIETALQDVQKGLSLSARPMFTKVTKWLDIMPVYNLSHPEAVKELEEKMSALFPGVMLAGCSYYGVGIADCITNGRRTAASIVKKIGLLQKQV